jgi:hypothetical protein
MMTMSKRLKFLVLYWDIVDDQDQMTKTIIDAGDHPNLHYQEYTTHRVDDRQVIVERLHRREVSWYETEVVGGKVRSIEGERKGGTDPPPNTDVREEESSSSDGDPRFGYTPDQIPSRDPSMVHDKASGDGSK